MSYPFRTDLGAPPVTRSARRIRRPEKALRASLGRFSIPQHGRWLLVLLLCSAAGCDQPPIEEMDSGVDGCRTDLALLCEGDNRIARDVCTGVSTLVETCPGACYRGACVDCAPHAGRLCIDGQVRDVDSCGTAGDVLETCAGPCDAGSCVPPECTPGASTVCVGDTVYSQDSCGNLENALTSCAMGCTAGACNGCTPNAFMICYRGDIYSLDSCLALGGVVEDCAETCRLDAGSIMCVTGATCTPGANQTCFLGDIHYVDSCGSVEPDIAEDCPSGCENPGGCLPCSPVPIGTICSDGNVHELVGGCPGTQPSIGALRQTCTQGCRDGECQTGACLPDVGTVCSGGNVHLVDSCGAVGARIETCSAGCRDGACSVGDAGIPPSDGGPGGGACSCSYTADGIVVCSVGAIRCSGCLGLNGLCDDPNACRSSCPSEFSCSGGNVALDGSVVASCGVTPEWPLLCSLVCPV